MNPSWMYVVIGVSTLVSLISVTCGSIPCPDGLYGKSCELNCSANCHVYEQSPDNSVGPCDITGYCLEGCKPGYQGRTCNKTCTKHCVICRQMNGACLRCDYGYHIKEGLCINEDDEPCDYNQHCASCRRGKCITGCFDGYFDRKCDKSCSLNCRNKRCKLGSQGIGECIDGCAPGYYGIGCGIQCDTPEEDCKECPGGCESGFCRLDDYCVSNCSGSHYGRACKTCPGECNVCNKLTGTCEDCPNCLEKDCSEGCKEGCRQGYYKNNCEATCSEHCILGCDQASGHCTSCRAGWYGPLCHLKCSSGCLDSCGRNGSCVNGCVRGLYGEKCIVTCPINCLNDRCLRDGTCNVCRDGYYGRECKKSCQNCDGVCDMDSGTCRKCKEYFTGSDCLHDCRQNCSRPGCDVYRLCMADKGYGSSEINYVPYFAAGAMVLVMFLLSTFVGHRLKRMNILVYGRTKSHRRQPEACIPEDQALPPEIIHLYDEVNENEVNTNNQQSRIEFDNVVRDSSVFPYENVHQDQHPCPHLESDMVENEVPVPESDMVEYEVPVPESDTVKYEVPVPESNMVENEVPVPESDMVEYENPVPESRPDVGVEDELHIGIPVQDDCSGRCSSHDSVSSLTTQPIYSQYLTCVHET